MKKYYKIIVLLAVVLCIGAGAVYVYVKADSKKTAPEYYFDVKGREYLQNMTTYSSESYDYDGYLIALDSSIYDEKTNVAYCVFTVKQKDGGTNFLKDGSYGSFGEDSHLALSTMLSGTINYKHELIGDTLYIYLKYSATEQYEEYRGKIFLVDKYKNESLTMEPTKHAFCLVGSDSLEYKNREHTIYLSPICLSITEEKDTDIDRIVLNFKNGNQKVIAEENRFKGMEENQYKGEIIGNGNASAVSGNQQKGQIIGYDGAVKKSVQKYLFYTPINIREIDSITVDDVTYTYTETE